MKFTVSPFPLVALMALLFAALSIPFLPVTVQAAPEMETYLDLKLEKTPVDMAVSADGRRIFVLTNAGEVLVYTVGGVLDETLPVGPEIDGIAVGQNDNILFLKSSQKRSVRLVYFVSVKTIDISDAPTKGNPEAPVTIILFSEFQCPHCRKVGPVLEKVLEKYPDQVRIAFKHYPLRYHDMAERAAAAAVAAQRQGKFWEMHDRLYEHAKDLSDEKIFEIAAEIGLDLDRFSADLDDPKTAEKVNKDKEDGVQAAVTGTPTIFINGRQQESPRLDVILSVVQREIATSRK